MPERKAVLELLEEHPAMEENLSLPNEKVVANIKESHPFAYGQNAPEGSLSEEKKVMSISISAEWLKEQYRKSNIGTSNC